MKTWRTFELTDYYYGMSLSAFEDMITKAKKTIKSSYPDVNIENDLTIDIHHNCHMDIYSVSLEFQSEETESEKIDRINTRFNKIKFKFCLKRIWFIHIRFIFRMVLE